MNNLYKAKGTLHYSEGKWLKLHVPHSIILYYKWWINKALHVKVSTPTHGAHITVVTGKCNPITRVPYEPIVDKKNWGKYENQSVSFTYDPYIHEGDVYFWTTVYSEELGDIREELGLPRERYHPYHITVGNKKNL